MAALLAPHRHNQPPIPIPILHSPHPSGGTSTPPPNHRFSPRAHIAASKHLSPHHWCRTPSCNTDPHESHNISLLLKQPTWLHPSNRLPPFVVVAQRHALYAYQRPYARFLVVDARAEQKTNARRMYNRAFAYPAWLAATAVVPQSTTSRFTSSSDLCCRNQPAPLCRSGRCVVAGESLHYCHQAM